jgi:glyoxylase-like metal-dependent hydrolase (beta-lactamase superfamily II)
VIDPGDQPEKILSFLQEKALQPEAVLLTHGHFDHVGAVAALAAEVGCPVYLHPAEQQLPPMMTAGAIPFTHTYGEGDRLTLAGIELQVLHTPGHTPGSVCLLANGQYLFSGDTLFAGSCGRVDFPGSSPADMRNSLARLAGICQPLAVYPGHAESTTLEAEKQYNPYLKGML